jgi:GNAT superfamily N-acetyltransferase
MSSCELQSVAVSAGSPEFWELLSLSVGYPTAEKMAQVRQAYREGLGRGLMVAVLDGRLVGAIGYQEGASGVEVKHLAVLPDERHSGMARALVQALIGMFPGKEVFAETHDGAVGFYKRLGFQCDPLPPKVGRDSRWKCRRKPSVEE